MTDVRLRWSGHRLNAEINLAVDPKLSVVQGHAIAMEARHQLLHHLPYLSNVTIHVDPENLSGEEHHRIIEHAHGDLSIHSHRQESKSLGVWPGFAESRINGPTR